MPDAISQLRQAMDQWHAGQRQQAQSAFKRILQREPNLAAANQAYAYILGELGQFEQAQFYIERALRAEPGSADIHYARGSLCQKAGDMAGTVSAMRKAVELAPDLFEGWWALAAACLQEGLLEESESAYRRTLELQPQHPDVVAGMVRIVAETARVGEAVELLRAATAVHPDSAALRSVLAFMLNYAGGDAQERFEAHLAFGRLIPSKPRPRPGEVPNTPDPDRRLRVGLVSADLREHSVVYFLESFLAHRDRAALEVICYHVGGVEDQVSARLRGLSDAWRHIFPANGLLIRQAIAKDVPDILVDLGGLTCPPALVAMANHAAPVQVSYLGYPDTTGVSAIDARIVDAVTDPPGAERWAVEKLVRLPPPQCFLCYRPVSDAPEPRMPEGTSVTFGSFNNPAKVSDRAVALWSRVLKEVPGSTLVLKGRGLEGEPVRRRLSGRFERAGLDPARVRFRNTIPGLHGHLAAYGEVDVALDPVPYNGTTTTCEALWMGVPVVGLEGSCHAARVGASLLTAAGLPELIARDEDEYVRIAAALAADRARREALRASLRARLAASPLCDGPAHARALGAALRGLWREWCAAG